MLRVVVARAALRATWTWKNILLVLVSKSICLGSALLCAKLQFSMKIIFSHQTHILVHICCCSPAPFFPPIATMQSTIHLFMFTRNDSNCYFTFWYQHSLVHRILRYIRRGQMHRPLAMVAQCLIHFQLLQEHPSLSPYPLEHTLGAAARAAFLAMLFTAFLKAMIANWYDQCVVAVAWRVELAAKDAHTQKRKRMQTKL